MASRVVTGALILVGGAAIVYGIIVGLSIASCPPPPPLAGGGIVTWVCAGPDLLPVYAIVGAGVGIVAIGLLLYLRARTR